MSITHEETTTMTKPAQQPARSFLGTVRHALGSVFALVYLGICAALVIWAVVVSNLDNPDASMAGVVPTFATAPVSLVMLVLPDNLVMIPASIALGALVNAFIIGWCARALARRLANPSS